MRHNYLKNRTITSLFLGVITLFAFSASYADQDLVSLFPINHYDQNVSAWINPSDVNYDKPLMTAEMQHKRMQIFLDHYVGSASPWDEGYVNHLLQQPATDDLKAQEQYLISYFGNEGKQENQIGYGENFRPHDKQWIDGIADNMNVDQYQHLVYENSNRGIAIDNLHARALPTNDVHYYSYKLAGQGYPFDNLQMSSLWAGTPVYILGETRDHAWMLVITPNYVAWVRSNGIARADTRFVNTWTDAAKNKLAAITKTQKSIMTESGQFLFSAYIGSVFPVKSGEENLQLMVPVIGGHHQAVIKYADLASSDAALMPLAVTRRNLARIIQPLIGRAYGWGGTYFYNDCSAELKSLMTPFGIWLPRHSSDQMTAGKMVDMSAATQEQRLAYLMENGEPFLTLIYIGGHVVLYIGNYPDPNQANADMAMTYQDVWGLSPNPATRRAVIGGSVFLPMLLQYPEDTSLISEAGKKYFQISYLNQLPELSRALLQQSGELKSLVAPAD